jgi:hypothetical protein
LTFSWSETEQNKEIRTRLTREAQAKREEKQGIPLRDGRGSRNKRT